MRWLRQHPFEAVLIAILLVTFTVGGLVHRW